MTENEPRQIFVVGRHITRRELLRLGAGLSGAALLSALAAACGGGDDDDTGDTGGGGGGAATATTATTGGTTPTAAGESSPTTAPAGGSGPATGRMTIALQFDIQSLDPIDTYSLNNGRWMSNVYSPLVWRDTELEIWEPPDAANSFGLAVDWEYIDDLTLEMKLREGVTFQNGEPFNAEAVKVTFDRLLNQENASPQRFNYTTIDHVEVIDDYTVRFIFAEIDPVMVTKLAGYGSFIVPPGFIEEQGDEHFSQVESPGTGPYRVREYVKDDRLVLEAWDEYWHEQKPKIKELIWRIIPDDNTRLAEFLAGSIALLTLTPSQADAVQGRPELQVIDVGVPTVSGLRLNAEMAPTDNLSVRKAIAHAIDLQTIIDTVLAGYARPVGVWQSPFSFGYEDIPPYEYDPEMARQFLAESGLQTPVPLTYDVIGTQTQAKEIASIVKDMLDAVGFQVEIRLREQATYFDDYRSGKLGNIVPFGWGGWTLDFDNTYWSMYKTGESYNPHYSNPEVDELLEEQRGTLDQARREEIAHELNRLIYEDYVDVALYQQVYLWGVNSRVKDLPLPPDERLWLLPASVEE